MIHSRGYRLSVGALGLVVVVGLFGRLRAATKPFRDRRTATALVGATFLGTYLGIWLMNAGFLATYVGVAATLNATSPIFALPLVALAGERVSARATIGAFIAVAGVALLFLFGAG